MSYVTYIAWPSNNIDGSVYVGLYPNRTIIEDKYSRRTLENRMFMSADDIKAKMKQKDIFACLAALSAYHKIPSPTLDVGHLEECAKALWNICQRVGDKVTGENKHAATQTAARDRYRFALNNITDENVSGLRRQARIILQEIKKTNQEVWWEKDLSKFIEQLKCKQILKTKQSSWRIFQYYRPEMISGDFLRRG